jgi:hypothetical protein
MLLKNEGSLPMSDAEHVWYRIFLREAGVDGVEAAVPSRKSFFGLRVRTRATTPFAHFRARPTLA